jgi:hypothetical protein
MNPLYGQPPAARRRFAVTDPHAHRMRLQTLKSQIADATYAVDPHAVAEAMLALAERHTLQSPAADGVTDARPGARTRPGGPPSPRA